MNPEDKIIAPPPFKSEDVCAIIKACGMSGVHEFEYCGLKLKLAGHYVEDAEVPFAPTIEPGLTPEIKQKLEAQTRASNEQEEYHRELEELDSLLITNPDAYFRGIEKGILVDEERA